jgi:hypothetical protein
LPKQMQKEQVKIIYYLNKDRLKWVKISRCFYKKYALLTKRRKICKKFCKLTKK